MTETFIPRTMLAPMEGVGHPLFRRFMNQRGGIDVICTEFVRVSSNPFHPKAFGDQIEKLPGTKLSVQVMGKELNQMREAAQWAVQLGADIVDINLGCPSPKAVRGGVGSAMLKDPQLLHAVISTMREVVPVLLSAKIRAGFDDGSNVLNIGKMIQDAGVDYIAVHPRRRCDFYQGVADWRIIKALKETLRIPVIGNGDCWYAADAIRMREETGCDGVMIGRPALRNPWIFQQHAALMQGNSLKPPDGQTITALFTEFCDAYEEAFRPSVALGKMKEIMTWFGRSVRDNGVFKKTVLRTQTMADFRAVFMSSLDDRPSSFFDLSPEGNNRLEDSGSAMRVSPSEESQKESLSTPHGCQPSVNNAPTPAPVGLSEHETTDVHYV